MEHAGSRLGKMQACLAMLEGCAGLDTMLHFAALGFLT